VKDVVVLLGSACGCLLNPRDGIFQHRSMVGRQVKVPCRVLVDFGVEFYDRRVDAVCNEGLGCGSDA
jgi:hypothetical protein